MPASWGFNALGCQAMTGCKFRLEAPSASRGGNRAEAHAFALMTPPQLTQLPLPADLRRRLSIHLSRWGWTWFKRHPGGRPAPGAIPAASLTGRSADDGPCPASSVPIPKLASPCSPLSCELRNPRDTSNSMILVPLLNPKFARGFCSMLCANFGFGALAENPLHCLGDDIANREQHCGP
jgi:hypothetical protein